MPRSPRRSVTPATPATSFAECLTQYADSAKAQFCAAPVGFEPEDQLKGLVSALLKQFGEVHDRVINTWTEVSSDDASGRPDMGVSVSSLLAGFIELKRPGKGSDPTTFRGDDRKQWERFKDIPNLIYTDGSDWSLYRNGEHQATFSSSKDLTKHGAAGLLRSDTTLLESLLSSFVDWQPIVPSTPQALGVMLARLCRLLRDNVRACLGNPLSPVAVLAEDWKKFFFPDADSHQFSDAYAQTVTYALLLGRLSGTAALTLDSAASAIRPGHRLLADALRLLGDPGVKADLRTPIELLERTISAVDVGKLARTSRGDPWLYFYEDFLAEYDPELRKNRGVYYTPVQIVKAQVVLVGEILTQRFGKECAFADSGVHTLDPATGTGTYLLTALEHSLELAVRKKGAGIAASAASTAARQMYGFEILVGPYSVSHLRLTQAILSNGGSLAADGAHIYLTGTLESPDATPPDHLPMAYRALGEEHTRAQSVKRDVEIMVCIGNPPYDRQTVAYGESAARKGGWVRFGDGKTDESTGILSDFIKPLTASGLGLHAKNLYNDYVYFFRWAIWKVLECKPGPGVVAFITASSYLAGPGFAGMRQMMRQLFDEIWIVDLEGESHGARPSENVFNIRTGVAIFFGVRDSHSVTNTPACVRYTRITGSQSEKLSRINEVTSFSSLKWKDCSSEWQSPFLPLPSASYVQWPTVFQLFPWAENGVQFKRSWPIGETQELLQARWKKLLVEKKPDLFRETADRSLDRQNRDARNPTVSLPRIKSLKATTPPPNLERYAYRTFDRRYALLDARLADRIRPDLLQSHSSSQLYMTSIWTKILGTGPGAIVTDLVPDFDHFMNRGAKDVIPLWRDSDCKLPNITLGLLDALHGAYGAKVTPEEFFAYCYAVMSPSCFVETFWDELEQPPPRVPITKDYTLFKEMMSKGQDLIYLHTFGEHDPTHGKRRRPKIHGAARCAVATPTDPASYPNEFSYDSQKQQLLVGGGVFSHVSEKVATFSVSDFSVVGSWIGYRMKDRKGRSSSPLDEIRPRNWNFDDELLNVLWVIEATLTKYGEIEPLLGRVLASTTFTAAELPTPAPWEQERVANDPEDQSQARLF